MNAGSLRRQPSRLTKACALLAAGLVLLLAVLAVCPEAHEHLCKDADRGEQLLKGSQRRKITWGGQ